MDLASRQPLLLSTPGSIRTLNMLRILLGAGFHVTFMPTAAQRFPRYPARLRALGVDVLPPRDSGAAGWNLRGRVGDGCPYDVILVARRDMYLSVLGALERQCPGLPRLYDTVDLHYLREARDAITADAGAGGSSAASTSQVGEVVKVRVERAALSNNRFACCVISLWMVAAGH